MKKKKFYIFFVDDEPQVCKAVELTLQRENYHVHTFTSASECFESLAREKCDVLISDVNMPEIHGIEFLVKVQSQYPWLPILMITGYGSVPMAVRAIKAGAVDFIEKPLSRTPLLEKVKLAIEQSARNSSTQQNGLSKAESRVLKLITEGKCNRAIAQILGRSIRTIEDHRANIMRKLGADNIVDLIKKVSVPENLDKNPQ
jgi:two-component system, LuxR family, response regulator FixJ